MALIIQKYGGTSVSTPKKIRGVAKRVVKTKRKGNEVVVVVSAMGDTTDKLLELAYAVNPSPSKRELDLLLSTGEIVSSSLLTLSIHSLGEKAVAFTGSQGGIITDEFHTKARIQRINPQKVLQELKRGNIVVVAGFQGVTRKEAVTTLGRGGSDTTAVALASALKAKVCEIYTDVEGVYTADPSIVPEARKLKSISYDEMLELASSGAKVLHLRAVELAKKYRVPLKILSSFSEKEGTELVEKPLEGFVVTGVALNEKEAKVTLKGLEDRPGIAGKIFSALARVNINVDMIVQSSGEGKTADISFTVDEKDLEETKKVVGEIKKEVRVKEIRWEENISKVSLVGAGMQSHPGVAARMFKALGKEGINIDMISTSEIKISCVVKREEGRKALRAIHREFKLEVEG